MRCPKCGYISFDHLETCLKCKKNIKSASDSLQGTVYNVAAPAFLKFNVSDTIEEEPNELDAFVAVDDEIEDADLNILLDESANDSPGEVQFEVEEEDEFSFDLEGDDSDFTFEADQQGEDEISLDMDAFGDEEEAFSGIEEEEGAEDAFKMDLPEELSDISDLEPPTPEVAAEQVDTDLSIDLDEDMDLGEFDIEVPAPPPVPEKSAAGKMSIDDDLDFELDLGDLFEDEKRI